MKKLTKLRHHISPPFAAAISPFSSSEYNEELGVKDVTWINANGGEMQAEDWGETDMQCFGMLLDGRSQSTGIRQRGQDATMLLVINGYHDAVSFTLPESPDRQRAGRC